jgi:hypothetical protein
MALEQLYVAGLEALRLKSAPGHLEFVGWMTPEQLHVARQKVVRVESIN